MKQGLTLLAILAILLGAGCQAAAPVPPSPAPPEPPPPQGFFLEVPEPQDECVVNVSPIRVSGSTSPEAQVSLNGELIDVDGEGNFAAMVGLEEGPNVIEVIATDYEGNEGSCILAVIYAP